jgi:acetyl-CoA acetyltransferase family protein
MTEAVIIDAVRTPIGRRRGSLADVHPADLLGHTLRALLERAGVDPAVVDDHITGNVTQVGEQSANVGRTGWLAAGLPESVPSVTIDRQCGSSQQALHFAVQGVMAGSYDVVVAAGVENMTRVPMMSAMRAGPGEAFPDHLRERYDLVDQGIAAERIAARWKVDRAACDEIALRSQSLAARAWAEGRFSREVIDVPVEGGRFSADETIRPTTEESLAALAPAFRDDELSARYPDIDWVLTAGNSSQISDGASAVLVMSGDRARELGLRPRARIHQMTVAGDDPHLILTAPIPATQKVLARAGLGLEDMDVVEINEAFAPVVLAWQRELGIADSWFDEHVNVNGGAIALGHPLGASGARLFTSMLHELERTGGRFGLQTMCEGGGLANATIVERLDS